jgi:hypothetical protein
MKFIRGVFSGDGRQEAFRDRLDRGHHGWKWHGNGPDLSAFRQRPEQHSLCYDGCLCRAEARGTDHHDAELRLGGNDDRCAVVGDIAALGPAVEADRQQARLRDGVPAEAESEFFETAEAIRKSGKYSMSGVSRSTEPLSTSFMAAIVANILLTEPMPNMVFVVAALPASRSARPKAWLQITRLRATSAIVMAEALSGLIHPGRLSALL